MEINTFPIFSFIRYWPRYWKNPKFENDPQCQATRDIIFKLKGENQRFPSACQTVFEHPLTTQEDIIRWWLPFAANTIQVLQDKYNFTDYILMPIPSKSIVGRESLALPIRKQSAPFVMAQIFKTAWASRPETWLSRPGGSKCTVGNLFWTKQLEKSAQGGSRDSAFLLENLGAPKRLKSPIATILIDDVVTTGAHMRAAYKLLSNRGYHVVAGLTIGQTTDEFSSITKPSVQYHNQNSKVRATQTHDHSKWKILVEQEKHEQHVRKAQEKVERKQREREAQNTRNREQWRERERDNERKREEVARAKRKQIENEKVKKRQQAVLWAKENEYENQKKSEALKNKKGREAQRLKRKNESLERQRRRARAVKDANEAQVKAEREAQKKRDARSKRDREKRERTERDARSKRDREKRERTERDARSKRDREKRERTERDARSKRDREKRERTERDVSNTGTQAKYEKIMAAAKQVATSTDHSYKYIYTQKSNFGQWVYEWGCLVLCLPHVLIPAFLFVALVRYMQDSSEPLRVERYENQFRNLSHEIQNTRSKMKDILKRNMDFRDESFYREIQSLLEQHRLLISKWEKLEADEYKSR